MHFTKTLSSILLAATAVASPLGSRNATLSKREQSDGQAGAYIKAGPGVQFNSVQGTVKMPDLTKADKNTIVSYWVGIDGVNTGRVIQAGFDAEKDKDGTITYQAWYEWFPEMQKLIPTSKVTASAGEEVAIILQIMQGGTAAQAAFVNKHTDQEGYLTPIFYTPDEESDATGINAEWVMEAPPKSTLANFGEIDFTHCSAYDGKTGTKYPPDGGTTLDLVRSGNTLATGKIIDDSNQVIITYTGP